MRYAHDEGVSHAERTVDISHAGVRPASREALKLIELIWDQTAIPAVRRRDNMFVFEKPTPPPHW